MGSGQMLQVQSQNGHEVAPECTGCAWCVVQGWELEVLDRHDFNSWKLDSSGMGVERRQEEGMVSTCYFLCL